MGEKGVIVIDSGSAVCKAGFAGQHAPCSVLPSVVAIGECGDDYHIAGDACCVGSTKVNLRYPIERGIVTNWEDMGKIWHQAFHAELKIDPAEHPVLLTEMPFNPKAKREMVAQIQFETFKVPSFYLAKHPLLSLWASGRKAGVVVDAGDGVTNIVPVLGASLPVEAATVRMDLAGRDLTGWLETALIDGGCPSTTLAGHDIARDIKEKLAYVALDYEAELRKADADVHASYTLADGGTIDVGSERCKCGELLFKPQLGGFEFQGVDAALVGAVEKCGPDARQDLYKNIVLSGGSTMLPGLRDRLEKEMVALAPPLSQVKVFAGNNRKYGAWIGGSIVASLPQFRQMMATREEYNEEGAGVVHRKCA